jgi:hypothetical protein
LKAYQFATRIEETGIGFGISGPASDEELKDPLREREPEEILIQGFPATRLQSAQRELRAGLQKLGAGETWKVPSGLPAELRIFRGDILRTYVTDDIAELFIVRAVDVIASSWKDVRRCARKECNQLFVPVGRQIHCSRTCMQRAKAERFEQRHPNRRRDYHAEYEARVKREWPLAKVGRRPRHK